MTRRTYFILSIIHIFILSAMALPGTATDIPYVFGGDAVDVANLTAEQLEDLRASSPELSLVPPMTTLGDTELLKLSSTGGGERPGGKEKVVRVSEMKEIFNKRVEPDDGTVRGEALRLASRAPGALSVNQICSIYDYLQEGDGPVHGWSYVEDPRGVDFYSYANQTIEIGKRSGCSGVGDCDDFAILMSSLIESIGGTTRIVLAYDGDVGHAYTEVYLGRIEGLGGPVELITLWLKDRYGAEDVYTHVDPETGDVWLNLDWGDPGVRSRPGGEFFEGDRHFVITIRDRYDKTSLRPPEGFVSRTAGGHSDDKRPSDTSSKTPAGVPVDGGAEAWIEEGIVLNNQGLYEEAIGCYEKALGLDSLSYTAWELKGLALRSLGDHEAALGCFDEAIGIDSSQDFAWRDKGELLYTMGMYQDAVYCFERAIEGRNCGSYWSLKGESLMALGDHAGASEAFMMGERLGKGCDYD